MSTFTIKHDTRRYGDQTGGLTHFGPRIVVSGVTADQAQAIAAAMSDCFDAGLTDQYVVQRCTASQMVLMSNPPQFQCRTCGQKWIEGEEPPVCLGWIVKAAALPDGVAPYSNDAKAIQEYNRLTQEEFRNRVLSPEFAAAADSVLLGGPIHIVREFGQRMDQAARATGTIAGPVICPHGKVEVYCSECDLKSRVELRDATALAVMEERERCAKIAESMDDGTLNLARDYDYGIKRTLDEVSIRIRGGQ